MNGEPVQSPDDRILGALIGLAVGDAVGTTVEFKRPGTFPPVTDMTGGGPFGLKPGQWTDDTSMALCLAESLTTLGRFDPADQLQRYVRWWREALSPWSWITPCTARVRAIQCQAGSASRFVGVDDR